MIELAQLSTRRLLFTWRRSNVRNPREQDKLANILLAQEIWILKEVGRPKTSSIIKVTEEAKAAHLNKIRRFRQCHKNTG